MFGVYPIFGSVEGSFSGFYSFVDRVIFLFDYYLRKLSNEPFLYFIVNIYNMLINTQSDKIHRKKSKIK